MVAGRLIETWRPTHILIEDTALGPALGGHLSRFGHNVVQVGIRGKSKEERFQNNLDRFKAHHVVLCEGPWLPCFLDEMVRFPFGEDDQIDALTQLLSWIRENPSPPARNSSPTQAAIHWCASETRSAILSSVQFALNGPHPAVRLGCYLPIVFS